MQKIDTDAAALDLLHVMRDVANSSGVLADLMKGLFSGPQGDSELNGLIRAVTRLRYLEMAILESLSDVLKLGPIEASQVYKDLSKSVITAALVHKEETAARLRCYYSHLLTEADIERIRLTVKTGMSREDIARAADYLSEIQERLGDRLKPTGRPF